MTYESVLLAQAELGIVSRSTTERKKMSTKTLRKRIALVTLVALGSGMLTSTAAFAGDVTAWTKYTANVTSINLTKATSSPTANAAVYVNLGAVTTASGDGGATNTGRVTQFRAALTSYPAGGYVTVAGSTNVAGASAGTPTALTGGTTTADATGITGAATGNSLFVAQTNNGTQVSASNITATSSTGIGSFAFTPTVAGTYVLTVWNDGPATGATTVGNGNIDISEAQQTVSIVVAAAAGYSNSLSTSLVGASADGTSAPLTAGLDDEVFVSKATGTDAGTIVVTVKNTSDAAFYNTTVEATVAGSGLVLVNTTDNTTDNGLYRSHSVDLGASANVAYVHVNADGTAGKGTVTVTVKDTATGAVLGVLATETFNFFGDVAKLEATAKGSVAQAGTAQGCFHASNCAQDTWAHTPFVIVKATDAAGVLIPALSLTFKTDDANVIGAGSATAVTTAGRASLSTAGVTTDGNGLGYYNASITGATGAASGKSTTVYFRYTLADGTIIDSNKLTVAVGGAVKTVSAAFDKAAYVAGGQAILTISAKDASGNAAYDGQAFLAAGSTLSSSATLGGALPTTSNWITGGKYTKSTNLFAPVTSGAFSVSGTGSDAAATAFTASATVSATAVEAQITSLLAKINALAKLVAKIQKKLGVK